MPRASPRRVRLTDRFIQSVEPPTDDRVEIWDAVVPQMALRVAVTGHRSFVVLTRVAGRPTRATLGSYPAIGLADARKLASQALLLAVRGTTWTESKRETKTTSDTFAAVAQQFAARHLVNNRSGKEVARQIERELAPRWGRRRLSEITRADIHAVLDRVIDRGTPYAANRLLATIRKLFNWAVDRGILEQSPAARIKAPARETKRDRVLADEELAAIWRACDQLGPIFGPAIRLMILTGQRRDEVGTMRWPDLDLERANWTLPAEATKAGRTHDVPLSPLAVATLQRVPRQSDQVFTYHRGRPISGWSRVKIHLDQVSGVSNWRLHDLRRTAASNMARLGVSRIVIGRVLNHAETGVTAIYDRHSYLDEKRRALEAWAARLRQTLDPVTSNVVALRPITSG